MVEEEYKPQSEEEGLDKEGNIEQRRPHKGGNIHRFEPTDLKELLASPTTVTYFKRLGCFEFCEQVHAVHYHPDLTIIFIVGLQDNQVTVVGITFTLSTATISATTDIPEVGEKWLKQGEIEAHFYEPYIKPRYKHERKGYFPFSYLLDRYSPMMKIIMKYFSCEGRFSRVYSYHIRLLMLFTRVKILNIAYYLFRSVDKMSYIAQKREPKDQMKSLFHHALIKIIVLYHLKELNIAWSTFIANPIFTHTSTQNVQNMPSSSHSPSPPLSSSHAPIPSPDRKQDSGKEDQGNLGQSNKFGRTGWSLDDEDDERNTIMLIKEREEMIGELQVNLQRAEWNISY